MNKKEREARRRDVCLRYRESGLSRAAFCASNGIARSTLGYWLKLESQTPEKRSTAAMVSVGTVSDKPLGRTARVRGRNGLVVEIDLPASDRELESIIRLVSAL